MFSQKLGAIAAISLFSPCLSMAAQDTSKPVTIRLVNGKTGRPMGNERLLIFFGTSPEGVRFHDGGSADLHTDSDGDATLPSNRSASGFFQVFVDFRTLCQSTPNGRSFSIAAILQNGLQSPNTCGKIVLANSPGSLVVYARGANFRGKMAR